MDWKVPRRLGWRLETYPEMKIPKNDPSFAWVSLSEDARAEFNVSAKTDNGRFQFEWTNGLIYDQMLKRPLSCSNPFLTLWKDQITFDVCDVENSTCGGDEFVYFVDYGHIAALPLELTQMSGIQTVTAGKTKLLTYAADDPNSVYIYKLFAYCKHKAHQPKVYYTIHSGERGDIHAYACMAYMDETAQSDGDSKINACMLHVVGQQSDADAEKQYTHYAVQTGSGADASNIEREDDILTERRKSNIVRTISGKLNSGASWQAAAAAALKNNRASTSAEVVDTGAAAGGIPTAHGGVPGAAATAGDAAATAGDAAATAAARGVSSPYAPGGAPGGAAATAAARPASAYAPGGAPGGAAATAAARGAATAGGKKGVSFATMPASGDNEAGHQPSQKASSEKTSSKWRAFRDDVLHRLKTFPALTREQIRDAWTVNDGKMTDDNKRNILMEAMKLYLMGKYEEAQREDHRTWLGSTNQAWLQKSYFTTAMDGGQMGRSHPVTYEPYVYNLDQTFGWNRRAVVKRVKDFLIRGTVGLVTNQMPEHMSRPFQEYFGWFEQSRGATDELVPGASGTTHLDDFVAGHAAAGGGGSAAATTIREGVSPYAA